MSQVVALNWTAEYSTGIAIHKLARAVETRYVRFIIEGAEKGDDKYIGLQVRPGDGHRGMGKRR